MTLWDILTHPGFFRLRPFDRLLFRFTSDLWEPQGASLMHWFSLALATLNVALITRATQFFVSRQHWWVGPIAGVMLAVYPLSIRDIGTAACSAHLGVTTATLVAMVSAE